MRTVSSVRGLIAAGLCAVVSAGSAAASDVEGVRAKFKEMDTNGDRSLQFSEIQAARAAIFDRMDVNGNAILDADEIANVKKVAQSRQASRPNQESSPRPGGMFSEADLSERAKLMDTNGDGKIARAEFVAFVPDLLKKADSNGDQTLSLRELRSLKRDGETSAKTTNTQ